MPLPARTRDPWRLIEAAVAVFFLAYQLYLSAAIWQRHGNIPPGFDDSFAYMANIRKVADYGQALPQTAYPPRGMHLRYLSYNYLMGSAALLLGLDAETVYRASFFVGKLALLACLYRFLSALESDRLVRTAGLAMLATFSGSPEFHGFYWVVPSFWLLCVFWYWLAEVTDPLRTAGPLLAAVGLLGGTLHRFGPYLVLVLGLYLLIWRLLERRPPQASGSWRALAWITLGVAVAVALPFLLGHLPGYRDINMTTVTELETWNATPARDWDSVPVPVALKPLLARTLPGLPGIWRSYFKFFQSPPTFALLAVSLGLVVAARRWALLALFLAALAFTTASAVHPGGSRSCLVLWPVTLLVLGVAPALAWRLLAPRLAARPLKLAAAAVLGAWLVVLGAAWLRYNQVAVRDTQRYAGEHWDPDCAARLLERTHRTSDPIYYNNQAAAGAFLSQGLYRRGYVTPNGLADHLRALPDGATAWAAVTRPGLVPPRDDVPDSLANALADGWTESEHVDCGAFLMLELRRR